MKKIRNIVTLLLVTVLVFSTQGIRVLAVENAAQAELKEVEKVAQSEDSRDDIEDPEEISEAPNHEEADTLETNAGEKAIVSEKKETEEKTDMEFNTLPEVGMVYVDTMEVEIPGNQNIAIIFKEEVNIDSSKLRYQIGDKKEVYTIDLDKHVENVLSFSQQYTEDSQTGVYRIIGLSYEVNGQYYEVEFEKKSTYSVDAKGSIVKKQSLIDITNGSSIEEYISTSSKLQSSVIQIDETFSISDISGAIAGIQAVQQEESIDLKDIFSDIQSQDLEEELIVVLEPTYCAEHSKQAVVAGLSEAELSLKIAEYVKAELETYDNIKVYLTGDNENCIYGTDYETCLSGRTAYAKSVGADIVIGIDVSLTKKTTAQSMDASITIYSSDYYNTDNLSDNILEELQKVGLTFEKLYTDLEGFKNSTYLNSAWQGDFSFIQNIIMNGMPCIVLHHDYIDDQSVLQLPNSESKLEALGAAEATVIARYFKLTKVGSKIEAETEINAESETITETEAAKETETSTDNQANASAKAITDAMAGTLASPFSRAAISPTSVSTQRQFVQNFVTRLYKYILNRTPDMVGLNSWVDTLINNKETGAEVAMKFINSPEFQLRSLSDSFFVDILYYTVLDRSGDADGVAYWNKLLGYGMSRTYVATQFLSSKEFENICSQYGITQGSVSSSENRDKNLSYTRFVTRLYEKALKRKYDIEGLNYWTGTLVNGKLTAEAVAEYFILSAEMQQKNYSNPEYVKVLYATFLDRDPETAGYNYHLNRLISGMSRINVMYGFSRSAEFKILIGQIISQNVNGRVMETQYWSDPQVPDRTLLAAIIYTEARGETYAGQLGVGIVVMNRINHANFPNNIRENIYWKNQFQPARTGVLTAVLKNTSVITASCWAAADAAIAMKNSMKTIPGISIFGKTQFDYLYFMTPAAYLMNKWLGDDTYILGNHVFFSRIGYR